MDQGIAKAIRMRALMSLAAYDEALIGEVGMQSKRHCYEEAVSVATELKNNYGYKLKMISAVSFHRIILKMVR